MMQDLRAFGRIDATLATSGQPTAEQLAMLGEQGIRHVINLALPSSDHAVADEGARLTAQGINYLHLPVVWESPSVEQFTLFAQILWALREESVLVHCALNMRASAFVFLYRVLYEAVPVAEAADLMHKVWQPDGVWREFIEELLAEKDLAYEPESWDA